MAFKISNEAQRMVLLRQIDAMFAAAARGSPGAREAAIALQARLAEQDTVPDKPLPARPPAPAPQPTRPEPTLRKSVV